MANDMSICPFQSPLALLMEKFLQEKRACGYRYLVGERILRRFDRFLTKSGLMSAELPGAMAKQWLSKTVTESSETHQGRITVVRQFSKFLCRLGYSVYVPDSTLATRKSTSFVPRILTRRNKPLACQWYEQWLCQ